MSWWEHAPINEMTIDEHEEELRQTVDVDVPERALADEASTCLGMVIENTAQTDRPESGTPESLNLHALMSIAVLSFRATRAAMAVVTTGYEKEAIPHFRTALELHAHRTAIEADATGEEARAWLNRKRRHGIGRRVQEVTAAEGLYGELCPDAHGDPEGIFRRLMLVDGDERAVNWGPHRTPLSRFLLHQLSGYCVLAAKALAGSGGVEVPRLDHLQEQLATAAARLKGLASGAAAA
jgi:hypothetical protein